MTHGFKFLKNTKRFTIMFQKINAIFVTIIINKSKKINLMRQKKEFQEKHKYYYELVAIVL